MKHLDTESTSQAWSKLTGTTVRVNVGSKAALTFFIFDIVSPLPCKEPRVWESLRRELCWSSRSCNKSMKITNSLTVGIPSITTTLPSSNLEGGGFWIRTALTLHQFCFLAGMSPVKSKYLSPLSSTRNENVEDLCSQRSFVKFNESSLPSCGMKIRSRL